VDVICEEVPGNQGDIGLITLNRQQALNALNLEMFQAIHLSLKKWESMKTIKAIVIRASEGRAFSAGGDIRYIYERKLKNDSHLDDFFSFEYAVNQYIFHYPKPYIALLNGITMGGGAGISIHGSHRIATEHVTFAMPETTIGFYPDIGASYFLSRLPHQIGLYLGLTGSSITYSDCYALHLVDAVIDPASQEELLQTLIVTPLPDYTAVTNAIHPWRITVSGSTLLNFKEDIEKCFSKNSVEEIIQTLRSLNNDWSHQIIKTLETKSPTSLKVAFQEINNAKKLNFDDCMKMENKIMQQMIRGHDFFEGVRALIIDKDKNPKWRPKTLEDVTQKEIQSYFMPFLLPNLS